MHIYLRTEDGKRGEYVGFSGTPEVRKLGTGERVGKGYPPHWGFWKRLWAKP